MVRVYLKDRCEIVDTLVNLSQFLKWAASNVVGSSVIRIKLHQLVAVLDSLSKTSFLQKGGSPNE